ncbi:MAG: hypothetical protein JNK82_13810 [Myxococcaceae bacterium]|nr:hypothetical protein [Myxococcaceae bacterium]
MTSALLALLAAAPRFLTVDGEAAARMAWGLEVPVEGTREETARGWLSKHRSDFGLLAEDELVLMKDEGDVVTFDRRRAGVSVYGGEVKGTFDDAGRLVMVYVGPPLPRVVGHFYVDVVRAELVATATLDVVSVTHSQAYWKSDGEALRPVWLVRFSVGAEPWRAHVDGATGRLLDRFSEKRSVGMGAVYDVSPAKGPVVMRALGGLPANATTLVGSRATMRNCNGAGVGAGCVARATANASFDFVETPSFGTSPNDRFGEVNAYYAVDRFSRWLSSLDAGVNLPPITAYTNVGNSNQGFFRGGDPQTGYSIELGQGPLADWAYEGDVTFHELGHGVVQSTANFGFYARDSQGMNGEGGALNEGASDCLAMALSGDPVLAEFLGPYLQDGGNQVNPYLRRMDQVFTCHGYDGNLDGGNPGRFGTIHDDGRILGSFFLALLSRSQ